MDPLSIAGTSVALAVTCGRASVLLYRFIADAKTVDATIESLQDDLTSMEHLLETVDAVFSQPHVGIAVTQNQDNLGGRVWRQASTVLTSCGGTLKALEKILKKVAKKQMLGRAWMQ